MNLSPYLSYALYVVAALSAVLGLVNKFTKAEKIDTSALVKRIRDLEDTILKLHKTDAAQQSQLNERSHQVQKLATEIEVYKEILENRSPALMQTLTNLEKKADTVFSKLVQWETIANEHES